MAEGMNLHECEFVIYNIHAMIHINLDVKHISIRELPATYQTAGSFKEESSGSSCETTGRKKHWHDLGNNKDDIDKNTKQCVYFE